MNKLICGFAGALVLVLYTTISQAALVNRGGGLIYDTELDVTWLMDANYAQTSGFDADGRMGWDEAVAWADSLVYYDSVRDVNYDDWRLPTTAQPDPTCSEQNSFGSFGLDCTGSEMGHLYNVDGVTGANPGLFINIQTHPNGTGANVTRYHSGTEATGGTAAWDFDFRHGYQNARVKVSLPASYALAVRSGDVVPIPAAIWLFGSGLWLLAWFRRRAA